jgi:hypothetical protein
VLGSAADVVALVGIDVAPEIPSLNVLPEVDLLLGVGMDVFVLGYPFGLTGHGLPVWKRGSLASEPHVSTTHQRYRFVDTASRPGMSGAPVIRRSWGFHAMADGDFRGGEALATKLVGVYAGRLATEEPLDAQLGIVWPAELLIEVVTLGKPDDGSDPE